jgi:SAM-dependent methyltransferase
MPCIVCNGVSDRVVWQENGYEGRSCVCGTVYTAPDPPPGAIDPTSDAHSSPFYSEYALLKARWIHRLQPSGRLLEIGCGDGHFLAAAKSLGYHVAGVEPHPARAGRVAERLNVQIYCSLLEDLKLPRGAFDIVYHCDLLSHFADPVRALRRMSGLLAPNGILAFEAGTLGGIREFWYEWIGALGFPQHRWLYSEHSLRALLSKAGLKILRMRHFGLAPAVALYHSRVVAAQFLRPSLRRPHSSPAAAAVPGNLDFYSRLEQFFRYRVGAIAPRFGPATWFIAAQPARAGQPARAAPEAST